MNALFTADIIAKIILLLTYHTGCDKAGIKGKVREREREISLIRKTNVLNCMKLQDCTVSLLVTLKVVFIID
jgi:hypothetical protein